MRRHIVSPNIILGVLAAWMQQTYAFGGVQRAMASGLVSGCDTSGTAVHLQLHPLLLLIPALSLTLISGVYLGGKTKGLAVALAQVVGFTLAISAMFVSLLPRVYYDNAYGVLRLQYLLLSPLDPIAVRVALYLVVALALELGLLLRLLRKSVSTTVSLKTPIKLMLVAAFATLCMLCACYAVTYRDHGYRALLLVLYIGRPGCM